MLGANETTTLPDSRTGILLDGGYVAADFSCLNVIPEGPYAAKDAA
jgi:hypothetical protein